MKNYQKIFIQKSKDKFGDKFDNAINIPKGGKQNKK